MHINKYGSRIFLIRQNWAKPDIMSFEWSWRSFKDLCFALKIEINDRGGESGTTFRLGLGFLTIWIGFPWLCATYRRGSEYPRETGVELYRIMGEWVFCWTLHHPTHSWSSKTPWYRYRYIAIADWLFGHWDGYDETIQTCEGIYVDEELGQPHAAKYAVVRYVQRRKRFSFIKRVFHRINMDLESEGLLCPGKGENSWDCEDSHNNGFSYGIGSDPVPEDWVSYANKQTAESMADRRARYGGEGWADRKREEFRA